MKQTPALATVFTTAALLVSLPGLADGHHESEKTTTAETQTQNAERQTRRNSRDNREQNVNPLMRALDRDNDGKLNEDEIRTAALSLRMLDQNKDGQLTAQEIAAAPTHRQPSPMSSQSNNNNNNNSRNGQSIERLMLMDRNNDGKLTKEEVPDRLWGRVERIDQNKDGVLDEDELKAVSERLSGVQQAGEEMRQRMEENYGRSDTAPVTPKRPPAN